MLGLSVLIERHRDPIVPTRLIEYTCGYDDFNEFLRSGAEVYTMIDLAAQRHTGKRIDEYQNILDFGCGCGRLLRFLTKDHSRIYGCDVNAEVAAFTKRSFPEVDVYKNDLMPPLIYKDCQFSCIYSYSVFSHLSLDVEDQWLKELVRVGAPGCLYLLTIHGDWMIEATLGSAAHAARTAGFYYRNVHKRYGGTLDFPDYYEASYHTSSYIHDVWSAYFDIIAVIKGDDPARYLCDDMAFEPQGQIPMFRPMGQDLVVARKR